MTLDIQSDFLHFDGLQAVQWRQAESGTEVAVPYALRRAVQAREAVPSHGAWQLAETTWHLPVDQSGQRPQPGDEIIEADATRWTVVAVEVATLSARWKVTARRAILHAAFAEQVTIETAIDMPAADGSHVRQWVVAELNVPARIQTKAMPAGDDHGQRARKREVEIYVEASLLPDRDYRVRSATGTLFHVTDVRRVDELASLCVLVAEATPWPTS